MLGSTVSIRIALHLALRVVPEAGVGTLLEPRVKGGFCPDFPRSYAPLTPVIITHTWFQSPLYYCIYTPICLCRSL